jgi:flagellar hook-basal body complex protein FliE
MDIRAITASENYEIARSVAAPQELGTAETAAVKWLESFAETIAAGEDASRAAMTGSGDPHQLVQALASTQMAVETVTTLRDKVVEAYQEILRMAV